MKILRIASEFIGTKIARIVVVAGDSDNVAGVSVALKFALYWAMQNRTKVLYIPRPIYFSWIFNTVKVHWLKKRHAIYDLRSPYIDSEGYKFAAWVIGHIVGLLCFVKFIIDIGKYKIGVVDQVLNYPRYIFGPRALFDVTEIENTFGVSAKTVMSSNAELELSTTTSDRCRQIAEQLGIGVKKYACLHIRTMHYKGTKDQENAGFRNSNPENYVAAIEHLISQEISVVRLGDRVADIIPAMAGYIDYPNSEYKSEEMDIFLIKNCLFYIGTNSGIFDLAALLQVPMLSVNVTEIMMAKPFGRKDIMLYKRLKRKCDSRILTVEEFFDLERPPSLDEYDFLDNSEEDILDAVKEMQTILIHSNQDESELQKKCRVKIDGATKRWPKYIYVENSGPTYMNVVDELKRVSSYEHYEGRVGGTYLARYYN